MPVTQVKRVIAKSVTPIKKWAPAPKAPPVQYALPEEAKEPDINIDHYTMLIYGRQKIGKTTLLSSFPEAIFFTTEPGTKGLRIYEFNHERGGCTSWEALKAGVALLEKTPDRFRTVIIDTVDRAYELCLEWTCAQLHIDHPGVDDEGKQDYGKSWQAVRKEFTALIYRIIKTGRGLCFTSHSKEQIIRDRGGKEYHRIYPTMSGQARDVVESLVDMFFFADYFRVPGGEVRRVLVCQGDDTIWAGTRQTTGKVFPAFLPIEREGGYEIIRAAFTGEYRGLDANTLQPAQTTTKTGKEFIIKQQAKAIKQHLIKRV